MTKHLERRVRVIGGDGAVVGVAEHGNSAVLVTIGRGGELLDRRRVDLTHDLPTHPYHHEGSWAVGRYVNSAWARPISLPDAVALVERVREAAAHGARERLEALSATVTAPIASIAIRVCPQLPSTTQERIADTRAANVADSVMYREALATAAQARGWSVSWYDRDRVFREASEAIAGEDIDAFLHAMGRSIGPPWQAGHKLAAAAALAARGCGMLRTTFRIDDLCGSATRALVAQHLTRMHEHSPPGSVHAFDVDKLLAPEVTFWSAWVGDALAGCGALKELGDARGEIKSMRVADAFLGKGVGRAVLDHIVAEARARGMRSLWLETGSAPAFLPAQRLYESAGFTRGAPFDGYVEDTFSICMTRTLAER